jgi:hypothetical protein
MVGFADFLPQLVFTVLVVLAGIISLAFSMVFVGKLGICRWTRSREFERVFTQANLEEVPRQSGTGVATFGSLRNPVTARRLRWQSKPQAEFQREKRYALWNRKLPMTRQVYERVRELATHPEPIYALLRTTTPPTLKKTDDGIYPIVTDLEVFESFDDLRLRVSRKDDSAVGTLHNHRNNADLIEDCERKFSSLDLIIGNKVHLIVCPSETRLYRALDGSAMNPRRTELNEVKNPNGK